MEKPTREAISIVIEKPDGTTLFALRSKNKKSFPLTWSLPSHFMREGDDQSDTIRRIGQDKLGVELEIGELLNEGKAEREDFILFMHDYRAKIAKGEPQICSDDYIELKWAEPMKQFVSMDTMGDCCRLYKEYMIENRAN